MDSYVLPRATLALAGGGLVAAAGLLAGRRSLAALRLPALAVALAALAAAALSIAPAASFVGSYSRYESLPMRLAYLGLFCGAAWLGERRRVSAAFLAGCGVAAAEAVYQALARVPFRPDGNLGQPNLLGALLAMAVPLALDRARLASPPARRGWLALVALLAAGLAVSTSRSGWLAAVVGACVLAVCLVPGRRLAPVLGATALVLLLAAALLLASPLRHLNQDTGAARLGVWRDSLAVVAGRPVLGWGEDTTGLVLGQHQTADWEPGHSFDRAHSLPLDLAATQGVAGLAACGWLLGAWWLAVWRRRQQPLAAGLAGAAAAYLAWALLNFDWVPATAAFWLLAGAAWPDLLPPPRGRFGVAALASRLAGPAAHLGWRGISHPVAAASPAPPPQPSPAGEEGEKTWQAATGSARAEVTSPATAKRSERAWRRVAAAAAVVAGLALAVPPQAADLELYAGRPDRAAAIDPLQARYQAALGSLRGLRRAAALGDPDPSTYVALGDAEARAGDPGAAGAAYRQALARYPYDGPARQRLGPAAPALATGSRRAASG